MDKYKHIVMFSGGAMSWACGKRVAERYGVADMVLLFADTKMEDEDLYRFLEEAAANIGAPLVKIADGRTPWEVMRDERIIGNSQFDPCSKILKRRLLNRWRSKHGDIETTTTYFGLDFTESHRIDRLRKRHGKWKVEAPMTWTPVMDKRQVLNWLAEEGLKAPRLYDLGFPHNNCGGFCVKAGQAHFANLLKTMPERYKYHEEKEEEMRALLGNHSILKRKVNGISVALPLRELRQRIEGNMQIDLLDWGGCGCAVE